MIRIPVLAGVIVAGVLALAGCSPAAAPAADPVPSASATDEATEETGTTLPPVKSLDAIADTRWIGTDSDGDVVTVKFLSGGGVHYTSYGEQFEYPEDTWAVTGDTIVWSITFGARYGVITYTGVFDAAAQTITASTTSTVGATGTADFRQPAR